MNTTPIMLGRDELIMLAESIGLYDTQDYTNEELWEEICFENGLD